VITDKWRAFGWDVLDVNGHNIKALVAALGIAANGGRPRVVIARTNILGGMRSIPFTVDGHWITMDPSVRDALLAELKAAGA